jgi:hypothetical protein
LRKILLKPGFQDERGQGRERPAHRAGAPGSYWLGRQLVTGPRFDGRSDQFRGSPWACALTRQHRATQRKPSQRDPRTALHLRVREVMGNRQRALHEVDDTEGEVGDIVVAAGDAIGPVGGIAPEIEAGAVGTDLLEAGVGVILVR